MQPTQRITRMLVPMVEFDDRTSGGGYQLDDRVCNISAEMVRVLNDSTFEVIIIHQDHRECVAAGLKHAIETELDGDDL